MVYYPPTKIYIKSVEGKGLGVFAREEIDDGEIIEICPLIFLDNRSRVKIKNPLFNYIFEYPIKRKNNLIGDAVIPWGYGCLYNHSSSNSNATWVEHEEYKAFKFIATQKIQPEEEICTYYGGDDYWKYRKEVKVI